LNEEHEVAGQEGHCIFLDTSSVKHRSETKKLLSKLYWLLAVIEQSNFKVSEFLYQKKDLPEVVCNIVRTLQQAGVKVKFIRLDNAGENVAFSEMANSKEWNLKLTFEFMGACTPQRNYLVEVGFTTLWDRLQAMLDAAFVPEEEKYKLVREGVFHLTFLDRLIVKEINGEIKTKYGHMYRMDPKVKMPLYTWGEGVIKIVGAVKGKLKPRGTAAMFVGYARDSTHDTMQMYSPDLNSIHETRDVQCSRKMYYEPEKLTQVEAVDSVEIMLNNMHIPVRTNRRAEVQEEARQVGARAPVSF
jgi:hypothetical protein